ncbi:MAG: AAA domain-containing protein [Geminicoccaceae bacterium]
MERHLRYWRNSLADAGRLSPSKEDLNAALKASHVIRIDALRKGALPRELATSLFEAWQIRTRLTDEDADDVATIRIAIYPVVFSTRSVHGQQQNPRGEQFSVPLCLSGKLARDGRLFPDDPEYRPLLVRDLLEPARHPETIGTLDEADRFYTDHPKPLEAWPQTIAYAEDLVEAVTGQSLDNLQLGDRRRLPYGLIVVGDRANVSHAILQAYDRLLELDEPPPLLRRLIQGAADEGLLDQRKIRQSQRDHLGHMTTEYGLAESQREALAHFLGSLDKPSEILAINGPPGTGKTTLIQSIVATLWVRAALDEAECPLIVAASSNNQAVTNVIDAFVEPIPCAHVPLSGRWIEGVGGHGLFLPALTADEGGRQVFRKTKDHFAIELETPARLNQNKTRFLERTRAAFPNKSLDDMSDAKAALHEKLKVEVNALLALIDNLNWLEDHTPDTDLSPATCQSRCDELDEVALAETRAVETASASHQELKTLAADWAQHQAKESFWLSLLAFTGPVRRWRQVRDKAFILNWKQQDRFHWLNETAPRDEIDSSIQAALARAKDLLTVKAESRTDAERLAVAYRRHSTDYEAWCRERGVDGRPDTIWDDTDKTLRHETFQLATHYWEAIYLMEVERNLKEQYQDRRSPEKLLRQYRRLAKLTPCFVSTVFMLPRFFEGWSGAPKPLWDSIDLLIIDEAGQTASDIGAASFAYAKRAMVVGDSHQIEPIWKIPELLDRANATKFELDDQGYESFADSGLSAARGSLMLAARRASRYTRFPDIARGLFLREHRRCLNEIIAYCNELTYRGVLQPKRRKPERPLLLPPLGFAHIEAEDRRTGGSRLNLDEAATIAEWISERRQDIEEYYADESKSIGDLLSVITPFRSQADAIRRRLMDHSLPVRRPRQAGITVGTVHALQGAEREIIIFSPTYGRRHRGQTFFGRDEKMLNVAVSRAKDSFLLFGNMSLFGQAAVGHSSRLLGRYLLHPSNEITDIRPILPISDARSAQQDGEVIRTLDGHRAIMQEALQTAEREVIIVSPFLNARSISKDQIDRQIARATERGISVKIITDATLNASRSDFESCLNGLKEAGADVFLAKPPGVHSKLLWHDQNMIAVGSFNWLSAAREPDHPYRRYEASALFRLPSAAPIIEKMAGDLMAICQPIAENGGRQEAEAGLS